MALRLDNGGNSYLKNTSSVVNAHPFTAGMWVRTTNQTSQYIWSNGDAVGGRRVGLVYDTTYSIVINTNIGQRVASAGTVTPGVYAFVLGRFIANNNRRISVLHTDGSSAHNQQTDSGTQPAFNCISIHTAPTASGGNTLNVDDIAEYWILNSDVQPDSAQTDEALLRILAYQGPFAVPHLRKQIVEYRSFRSGIHVGGAPGDVWFSQRYGAINYTQTGSISTGIHPSQVSSYLRPFPKMLRNRRPFLLEAAVGVGGGGGGVPAIGPMISMIL